MNTQRPMWNEEMAKELAVTMADIIAKWSKEDPADYIDDCAKILRWNSDEDGYHLAKELDHLGYDPDSELCEALDSLAWKRREIYVDHIKKWVTDNNLQISFSIGDSVNYRQLGAGMVAGKVVELYPETLQIGVRAAHQGQTSHYIIDQERLNLIEILAQ
jgi:hypothetical protein